MPGAKATDEGLAVHGGDSEAAAARYGVDPSTLLDLSANLNPLGPPQALVAALRDGARDTEALQRYPEPTYRSLRERLALKLGIDAASIVVGNGAASLLELALRHPVAVRCVLPVPAFSEDARALDALRIEAIWTRLEADANFALDPARLIDRVRQTSCDVALLTNPHNPSGAVVPRWEMLEIAESLATLGCRTIVDEAFIDYVPGESVVDAAARSETLTCVRSLTKFYAVPGLRVGYAVCSPSNAAALRAHLPSWPVTTLAATALAAAFGDADFERRTLASNAVERSWLSGQLQSLGCHVVPSAANFVLAALPSPATSEVVTSRLVREFGVLVRDCGSYEGLDGEWIRVAIRTRRESQWAAKAIGAMLSTRAQRTITENEGREMR